MELRHDPLAEILFLKGYKVGSRKLLDETDKVAGSGQSICVPALVLLQEAKEGWIPHCLAQVPDKLGTPAIDCVDILAVASKFVHERVDLAGRHPLVY